MTNQPKKILCLDFDGVLHSYTSGWHGADIVSDPPVEGASDFVWQAIEHFNVVISSSRNHQDGGILAMQEWLREWGFPVDQITFANGEKPAAHVTLDDRGWQFNGTFPSMDEIIAFKPYYKR